MLGDSKMQAQVVGSPHPKEVLNNKACLSKFPGHQHLSACCRALAWSYCACLLTSTQVSISGN